jgi:outer membrane murein-binding lipoprotein Lpp
MDELRKTQNETLAQCKLLCESQNAKFSELRESMDLLSSQVVDLKSENDKLQNNITNLNKRVQALESTSTRHLSSSTDTVPSILQEITERERCSRNVIIRGIPESSSSLLEDRMSNDSLKIAEVIQPYFPELPSGLKSIRLGKPNDRGPRPLKVFFSSKEIAHKLISDFNINVRGLPSDSKLRSISVIRDRTPRERESIRLVYAELENRKKNGETDIVINYRDGFPCIVPFHRSSHAKRLRATSATMVQSKNY